MRAGFSHFFRFLHKPFLGSGFFFLVGLLCGFFLFTFIRAGSIYEYSDTVDGATLPDADAIVVLAGGRGRISAAGDFWFRYREREESGVIEESPLLYLSGLGPTITFDQLHKLVRAGVVRTMRPSDVVLETESRNTEENALWVVKNARLRGWKRIVLMTSPYHMRRSQWIFQGVLKEAGLSLKVDTLSIDQEPFNVDEWRTSFSGIRMTVFEYLKWLYYTTFWKADVVAK